MNISDEFIKGIFVLTNPPDLTLYLPIINELFKKNPRFNPLILDVSPLSETFPQNKELIKKILLNKRYNYFTINKNFLDKKKFTFLNDLIKMSSFVVVVTDHSLPERTIIQLADRHGIPTFMILNGVISQGKLDRKWSFRIRRILGLNIYKLRTIYQKIKFYYLINSLFKKSSDILLEIIEYLIKSIFFYDLRGDYGVDMVFCYGEIDKKVLLSKNPKLKIIISGNPRIDSLKYYITQGYQNKEDNNKNKQKLLVISSSQVEHGVWSPKMKQQFLYNILWSIEKLHSHFDVYIRPHPKEDIFALKKYVYQNQKKLKDNFNVIVLNPQEPLFKHLYMADVVLLTTSTVILDSIFLGKKTVLVDFFDEGNYFGQLDDIIFTCNTKEELYLTLKELIKKELTNEQLFNMKKIAQLYVRNYGNWDASKIISKTILEVTNFKKVESQEK